MIAKPTSIKGTGGKSGGCAWKAIEFTSGDLLHVTESRSPDRRVRLVCGPRREYDRLVQAARCPVVF
jgi:hypothetical protein